MFKKIDGFQYRGAGAFQAYLRQAVLNRIRNEIRNAAWRPERVELNDQLPDDGRSPLDLAMGLEAVERMRRPCNACRKTSASSSSADSSWVKRTWSLPQRAENHRRMRHAWP